MKKILSILFVLVFSLSFSACSLISGKNELVTHEEAKIYIDNLQINTVDSISYKVTVKYSASTKTTTQKKEEEYTVKGSFNYQKRNGNLSLNSYRVTKEGKNVTIDATVDGKQKTINSYKKTYTCLSDFDSIHVKTKESTKAPKATSEVDKGEYFTAQEFNVQDLPSKATLTNIISYLSISPMDKIFFNGDNFTIIRSTSSSHVVVDVVVERREIKSINVTETTADSSLTISAKVYDEIEISEGFNFLDFSF